MDRTPLDGDTVDVEARCGFLLRHSREYCGNPAIGTGRAMVAALAALDIAASQTDISNWERGTSAAPGRVIEAYEALTGAHPGSLRGIIEIMRRCYSSPPASQRYRDTPSLAEVTRRCELVFDGQPRGIDWLHFADLLTGDRVALPTFLVDEPVARLLSEMNRSVGPAYLSRYEALARILESPYGSIVRAAVEAAIFDEHAQVVLDAICLLSESPDPDTVRWLATLLCHPRPIIACGAAYAIDNALEHGRIDDATVDVVSARVIVGYLSADERGRRAMASVIRALPADRMDPLLAQLDDAKRAEILAVPGRRTDVERARLVDVARQTQRSISGTVGHDHQQPLLARIVYELVFDERATRRFHAASMVHALPYCNEIALACDRLSVTHEDGAVRMAATEAVLLVGRVASASAALRLIGSPEPDAQRAGLLASAHCQIPLETQVLQRFLDCENPLRGAALYSAGMNGHPLIERLATDRAVDPRLRGAAQWWHREGRAVLD